MSPVVGRRLAMRQGLQAGYPSQLDRKTPSVSAKIGLNWLVGARVFYIEPLADEWNVGGQDLQRWIAFGWDPFASCRRRTGANDYNFSDYVLEMWDQYRRLVERSP